MWAFTEKHCSAVIVEERGGGFFQAERWSVVFFLLLARRRVDLLELQRSFSLFDLTDNTEIS